MIDIRRRLLCLAVVEESGCNTLRELPEASDTHYIPATLSQIPGRAVVVVVDTPKYVQCLYILSLYVITRDISLVTDTGTLGSSLCDTAFLRCTY